MSSRETSRWERRTWPYLKQLASEVPEAGIHFQSPFSQTIPIANVSNSTLTHSREQDLPPGERPQQAARWQRIDAE
jgi:hypothetical protein